MNYIICNCLVRLFSWSAVTPIVAIVVSIIALFVNRSIAQRNTRLTIQQALFKTVTEKVKDCNALWDNRPENQRGSTSPNFKIMSELIISIEIIDKSLSLFEKNYKAIRIESEDDYYNLFYGQLRTDLREWIKSTKTIAKKQNSKIYDSQVELLFRKFERHFEKVN
ncbi:hypothetical protein LV84_00003 [Algoriphagus ratkowskyi]|uniref:DUF4760 domain-containing protein n=1 Tax=Algoriphagus ratkowskyi TaxID=57028 RepID=A0A2W7SDV4_9BACT|nr:hypothetical protein [Algoriphagus ratkowskyi]PZX61015.1 hypothetical protein LV84_00003 [Algoriphagus ratkowskyi]TXD79153.1 hypothetical protein ESW18_02640 [Algoriphagus ratkowskyi]